MSLINQENLTHYLKLNYNVLLKGRHGVGKTAVIKEIFESAGLRWKYFSASTLDPWIDFIGMPRIVDTPDGSQELKLIRPSFIEHDEVDAIFFDEYNRAPSKVINSTMELIQFKSINGHRLKNLRVIWAAINPEDDEDTYSVNTLDPAHIDRFEVQIDVPYQVDKDYFLAKYPSTGQIFIDWWKSIPLDIRYKVSPRRLDFAANAYANKCRLEDFIPVEANVKALRDLLKNIPFFDQVKVISTNDEAVKFLSDVNNTTRMLNLLRSNESTAKEFLKKYAKFLPKELADPFIECLQVKKAGFSKFSSLDEMIEKLPGDKGTPEVASIINNINFHEMLGGDDLGIHLSKLKLHILKKLELKVSDIFTGYDSKTIERLLWGIQGRKANSPQNFYKLTEELVKMSNTFTQQSLKFNIINWLQP